MPWRRLEHTGGHLQFARGNKKGSAELDSVNIRLFSVPHTSKYFGISLNESLELTFPY